MRDVHDVLAEVNRREGSSWQLVDKLPGGYQGGAFLLEPTAVLKIWSPSWSSERLDAAARLLGSGRRVGWPTPRWLSSGALPDDRTYLITDFVRGSEPADYDDSTVDALLRAVALQDGLAAGVEVDQDWSRHVRGVVFGTETERQRADVEQFSAAGAQLVAVIDDRCAGLEALVMPTDDLVHGDLCLDNARFVGGELVGLIDAQHAGQGTRAVDIAGMLRHAMSMGASRHVLERLTEAGDAVAGPDVFAVCLAASILGVLSFGTWNWPGDVDAQIPSLQRLLAAP